VVYGCGATGWWDGVLVYVDVPENEIQFRMQPGYRNLGLRQQTINQRINTFILSTGDPESPPSAGGQTRLVHIMSSAPHGAGDIWS
jgi:hypothetical protein